MSASKFEDVTWRCDGCNACLNDQDGFSDDCGSWTCTECGYVNSIEEEDILEKEHCCPNCGANLKKQIMYDRYTYDYTCGECDAVLHREYSCDEFSVVDESDICPSCGKCLLSQRGYDSYAENWTCSECDAILHREYSDSGFSVVDGSDICPSCGNSLLAQSDYSSDDYDWICTECEAILHRPYYGSSFSVVDESDICPSCGKSLLAQNGYDSHVENWTCTECDAILHRDHFSDNFSIAEEEDMCPVCGEVLWKQAGYSSDTLDWTCTECFSTLTRVFSGIKFSLCEDEEGEERAEETHTDEVAGDGVYEDEYENENIDEHEDVDEDEVNAERDRRGSRFSPQNSDVPASRQRIEKQSKGAVRKKRVLSFLFFKKNIPIEFSSTALCQKSANEIYAILYNAGFKHIRIIEKEDVDGKSLFWENRVEKVTIDRQSRFEAFAQFPYTAEVEIVVHRKKQIKLPYSVSYYNRKNYEEVFVLFHRMGFTNIHYSQIPDVKLGLFVRNGSVETVTIKGNARFKKGQVFPFDSPIVIVYHTKKWWK